jgi:hypothetical protein
LPTKLRAKKRKVATSAAVKKARAGAPKDGPIASNIWIIEFAKINKKLDEVLRNQKLIMIHLQNPPATAELAKAVDRVSLKAKAVDKLVLDKPSPVPPWDKPST